LDGLLFGNCGLGFFNWLHKSWEKVGADKRGTNMMGGVVLDLMANWDGVGILSLLVLNSWDGNSLKDWSSNVVDSWDNMMKRCGVGDDWGLDLDWFHFLNLNLDWLNGLDDWSNVVDSWSDVVDSWSNMVDGWSKMVWGNLGNGVDISIHVVILREALQSNVGIAALGGNKWSMCWVIWAELSIGIRSWSAGSQSHKGGQNNECLHSEII